MQKTAYEMRISVWSSDVCSSDLQHALASEIDPRPPQPGQRAAVGLATVTGSVQVIEHDVRLQFQRQQRTEEHAAIHHGEEYRRSEEHTSELQSLMRISYAVFCLKNKQKHSQKTTTHIVINTSILYTTDK